MLPCSSAFKAAGRSKFRAEAHTKQTARSCQLQVHRNVGSASELSRLPWAAIGFKVQTLASVVPGQLRPQVPGGRARESRVPGFVSRERLRRCQTVWLGRQPERKAKVDDAGDVLNFRVWIRLDRAPMQVSCTGMTSIPRPCHLSKS